ncbi:MAG: hypothetical protein VCA18_02940, partial [Opitutales bacterium]
MSDAPEGPLKGKKKGLSYFGPKCHLVLSKPSTRKEVRSSGKGTISQRGSLAIISTSYRGSASVVSLK